MAVFVPEQAFSYLSTNSLKCCRCWHACHFLYLHSECFSGEKNATEATTSNETLIFGKNNTLSLYTSCVCEQETRVCSEDVGEMKQPVVQQIHTY